jgi:hypothetical protein
MAAGGVLQFAAQYQPSQTNRHCAGEQTLPSRGIWQILRDGWAIADGVAEWEQMFGVAPRKDPFRLVLGPGFELSFAELPVSESIAKVDGVSPAVGIRDLTGESSGQLRNVPYAGDLR